ncbi:MAG: hypothetical protein KIT87_03980 [Anaerolineae bacterium]|nr:hypothetical protein [Anaerolineae bacterium]
MWRQVRRGARVGMLCLLCLLLFNSASTALASEPEAYAGASLSGIVWQDYCASNCTAGSSLRRGNGQPDEAEVRLAGLQVGLSRGSCWYSWPTRFTTTDSQGRYSFSGLAAGTYCVTVNSRQSATAFPKPGVWTRPSGRSPWYIASYTVVLGPASSRSGLNFGWDTTAP